MSCSETESFVNSTAICFAYSRLYTRFHCVELILLMGIASAFPVDKVVKQ